MKHVAAYLLAVLGGNKNPSEADVKKILASVNASADDDAVAKVVSELQGKSVYDVIDSGASKLSAVPTGGSRAAPSGGAAPAAGAPAAAAAAPEPAKPESSSESEEDMVRPYLQTFLLQKNLFYFSLLGIRFIRLNVIFCLQ